MCVLFLEGRGDIQPQLDSAMQDVSDKFILLEETEKQALRKALIEHRQRICCFVTMLRPVVVSKAAKNDEYIHILLLRLQEGKVMVVFSPISLLNCAFFF